MTRRTAAGWVTGLLLVILALGPRFGPSVLAQAPPLHMLTGYLPPSVADGTAQDQGPKPSSDVISIAVSVALRNQSELNAFLTAVSDPGSPSYHRYLTQSEANDRFNPTVDQQQQVL